MINFHIAGLELDLSMDSDNDEELNDNTPLVPGASIFMFWIIFTYHLFHNNQPIFADRTGGN